MLILEEDVVCKNPKCKNPYQKLNKILWHISKAKKSCGQFYTEDDKRALKKRSCDYQAEKKED